MADEVIQYKVEIDETSLLEQLASIRSQIDQTLGSSSFQASAGAFSPAAASYGGAMPQFNAPEANFGSTVDNIFWNKVSGNFADFSTNVSTAATNLKTDATDTLDKITTATQPLYSPQITDRNYELLPNDYFGYAKGMAGFGSDITGPVTPTAYREYSQVKFAEDTAAWLSENTGSIVGITGGAALGTIGAAFGGPVGALGGAMTGWTIGSLLDDTADLLSADYKKVVDLSEGMREIGRQSGFSLSRGKALDIAKKVDEFVNSESGIGREYSLEEISSNILSYANAGGFTNTQNADEFDRKIQAIIQNSRQIARSLGMFQEDAMKVVAELEQKQVTTLENAPNFVAKANAVSALYPGTTGGGIIQRGLSGVDMMQGFGYSPETTYKWGVDAYTSTLDLLKSRDPITKNAIYNMGGAQGVMNTFLGQWQQMTQTPEYKIRTMAGGGYGTTEQNLETASENFTPENYLKGLAKPKQEESPETLELLSVKNVLEEMDKVGLKKDGKVDKETLIGYMVGKKGVPQDFARILVDRVLGRGYRAFYGLKDTDEITNDMARGMRLKDIIENEQYSFKGKLALLGKPITDLKRQVGYFVGEKRGEWTNLLTEEVNDIAGNIFGSMSVAKGPGISDVDLKTMVLDPNSLVLLGGNLTSFDTELRKTSQKLGLSTSKSYTDIFDFNTETISGIIMYNNRLPENPGNIQEKDITTYAERINKFLTTNQKDVVIESIKKGTTGKNFLEIKDYIKKKTGLSSDRTILKAIDRIQSSSDYNYSTSKDILTNVKLPKTTSGGRIINEDLTNLYEYSTTYSGLASGLDVYVPAGYIPSTFTLAQEWRVPANEIERVFAPYMGKDLNQTQIWNIINRQGWSSKPGRWKADRENWKQTSDKIQEWLKQDRKTSKVSLLPKQELTLGKYLSDVVNSPLNVMNYGDTYVDYGVKIQDKIKNDKKFSALLSNKDTIMPDVIDYLLSPKTGIKGLNTNIKTTEDQVKLLTNVIMAKGVIPDLKTKPFFESLPKYNKETGTFSSKSTINLDTIRNKEISNRILRAEKQEEIFGPSGETFVNEFNTILNDLNIDQDKKPLILESLITKYDELLPKSGVMGAATFAEFTDYAERMAPGSKNKLWTQYKEKNKLPDYLNTAQLQVSGDDPRKNKFYAGTEGFYKEAYNLYIKHENPDNLTFGDFLKKEPKYIFENIPDKIKKRIPEGIFFGENYNYKISIPNKATTPAENLNKTDYVQQILKDTNDSQYDKLIKLSRLDQTMGITYKNLKTSTNDQPQISKIPIYSVFEDVLKYADAKRLSPEQAINTTEFQQEMKDRYGIDPGSIVKAYKQQDWFNKITPGTGSVYTGIQNDVYTKLNMINTSKVVTQEDRMLSSFLSKIELPSGGTLFTNTEITDLQNLYGSQLRSAITTGDQITFSFANAGNMSPAQIEDLQNKTKQARLEYFKQTIGDKKLALSSLMDIYNTVDQTEQVKAINALNPTQYNQYNQFANDPQNLMVSSLKKISDKLASSIDVRIIEDTSSGEKKNDSSTVVFTNSINGDGNTISINKSTELLGPTTTETQGLIKNYKEIPR